MKDLKNKKFNDLSNSCTSWENGKNYRKKKRKGRFVKSVEISTMLARTSFNLRCCQPVQRKDSCRTVWYCTYYRISRNGRLLALRKWTLANFLPLAHCISRSLSRSAEAILVEFEHTWITDCTKRGDFSTLQVVNNVCRDMISYYIYDDISYLSRVTNHFHSIRLK